MCSEGLAVPAPLVTPVLLQNAQDIVALIITYICYLTLVIHNKHLLYIPLLLPNIRHIKLYVGIAMI